MSAATCGLRTSSSKIGPGVGRGQSYVRLPIDARFMAAHHCALGTQGDGSSLERCHTAHASTELCHRVIELYPDVIRVGVTCVCSESVVLVELKVLVFHEVSNTRTPRPLFLRRRRLSHGLRPPVRFLFTFQTFYSIKTTQLVTISLPPSSALGFSRRAAAERLRDGVLNQVTKGGKLKQTASRAL